MRLDGVRPDLEGDPGLFQHQGLRFELENVRRFSPRPAQTSAQADFRRLALDIVTAQDDAVIVFGLLDRADQDVAGRKGEEAPLLGQRRSRYGRRRDHGAQVVGGADAVLVACPPAGLVAGQAEAVVMVAFLEVPVPLAVAAAARGQQNALQDGIVDGIVRRIGVVVNGDIGREGHAQLVVAGIHEALHLARTDLGHLLVVIELAVSRTARALGLALTDLDDTHRDFISDLTPRGLGGDGNGQAVFAVGRAVPIEKRHFAVDPLDRSYRRRAAARSYNPASSGAEQRHP